MIKRIENISNFGIYKNFNWNSISGLVDFSQKNLFYGWNYSGKTTLSRIFSSLQNKKIFDSYSSGDFKIITDTNSFNKSNLETFPFKLLVFNSDYIKENLKWELDNNINAIFFEVGEKAKISEKINVLEREILKINGSDEVKGEREKFNNDINAFEIFEDNLFTNESRRIKNEVFSSLIEFNKGHFKKQLSLVAQNISSFNLKKDEIERLNKIVKIEKPKPEIDTVVFDFQINYLIDEVNKMLISEPSKQDVLQILDNSSDAFQWVKKGLEINKEDEKCLFCDNIISKNRIDILNRYYQNQAAKLRNSSQLILERIKVEKESLKNINFPKSIQEINDGYQEQYAKSKKVIDKEITKYIKELVKAENLLSQKIENKIYEKVHPLNNYDIASIQKAAENINEILNQNNKFSREFDDLIQSERNKYINHLVGRFLKENQYLSKQLKYEKSLKEIEKLNAKIDTNQKEIERLKALRNSAEEGSLQFDYFIQSFLGKEDIRIKYNESVQKYNLYRGDEIAKHLSEGEKMAISFSHYLVTLKSLELKNELKDTILFIDDPISSLDGNHIFQINALLKDFLYKKVDDPNNVNQKMWIQKCKQLFISTHNYEFFNLLKEMPTQKGYRYKRDESRYFISRKLNESGIVNLPKVYDDFKSEYHYLFKLITEFSAESTSENVLIMPNVLRRFLEIYTLAKYPSTEEVDDRATEIWNTEISKRICKPFHYFSHFNNIDRIGQHSELLADISQSCKELIKQLKKDKTHYKALQATL
ncbi:AAA family ATPase [Flavobacterium sp. IMCC34852]|uniref:AAA family ATPase n=1 Tax=Flavobacterium rivulicola TaxID=2732161 RepID=A0A7Y3VYQ6_9FLAO|nr:AAA family ATPase [Flavobacterium sp. IMCC34852]NNT71671.1 AAA family ATPase [Flavobacterium sp. IMCC34852]